MAAQGCAAVGHQTDARPHHTSRSEHLRQCGADDNQIDQDELFDCHVDKKTAPDELGRGLRSCCTSLTGQQALVSGVLRSGR
ncbi:hypothetical protein MRB56_07470 [Halomonas cupida]|uniref:hypothetical protein n=1 Tax=Halomonas cupida TaxID=44933 RepID=UPI00116116A8|nr:hypothetical protein [Halomonas cupida]